MEYIDFIVFIWLIPVFMHIIVPLAIFCVGMLLRLLSLFKVKTTSSSSIGVKSTLTS